jgi:hypothetical protein
LKERDRCNVVLGPGGLTGGRIPGRRRPDLAGGQHPGLLPTLLGREVALAGRQRPRWALPTAWPCPVRGRAPARRRCSSVNRLRLGGDEGGARKGPGRGGEGRPALVVGQRSVGGGCNRRTGKRRGRGRVRGFKGIASRAPRRRRCGGAIRRGATSWSALHTRRPAPNVAWTCRARCQAAAAPWARCTASREWGGGNQASGGPWRSCRGIRTPDRGAHDTWAARPACPRVRARRRRRSAFVPFYLV